MTTQTSLLTASSTVAGTSPVIAAAKARGVLALAVGKDQLVHLNAGYPNKFKAQTGQKYKLVRDQANKVDKDAADNVIATQQGDDLLLRYEDGTTVQFESFYTTCKDASVCSVTLAGDTAEGHTISGDSPRGAAVGEGTTLVYAHGSHTVLMEMAQGHVVLGSTILALGDAQIATYLPATSSGPAMAAADAGFNPAVVLGMLGGGAALSAGGGSSAAAAAALPSTTISGFIVAGAVKAGNGLTVSAFKANGTLLASGAVVDATGHYKLSYTDVYSGAVLLKVVDSNGGVDYLDEATGTGKSLSGNLFAVVSVGAVGASNQAITAHITPLTDLAAKKIGLTLDSISGESTITNVANINNAFAKFFGLTTGGEQITALLPTPVKDSLGNAQVADIYGKMLAIISGSELQRGQTTESVLTTLAAGITVAGTTANYNNLTAAGADARALLQDGVSRALQSGALTLAVSKEVLEILLPSNSITAPHITLFSDRINFKAGESATVYFKLSAASSDFTAGDITASGGTLSALTQDVGVPTLYMATFTPFVNQVVSAVAKISVDAGKFTNSFGTANTASSALTLTGDTLVPTVIITNDKSGVTNSAITYTFTFNEAVTGFNAGDVTVVNGSKGTFTALSATSYTLVVQPTAGIQGNVTVDVAASAAQDAVGNNSAIATQSVQIVDTLAPTVVITDDKSGVAGGAITYTFTFSEAVTNFSAAGVTVANGTKGTFTAVSATSYTLVVAPTSNFLGNVTVDIAANAAQDTVGNHSTVATQSVQAVDTRALTVLIADDKSGVTNGPITYTFTFSDAVTGFTVDDVTVANGTKGTLTTLSARSYSLVVQPTANFEGNVTVDIAANAAQNTAGKNSLAATQFVQLVDTLAPTVQAITMASIPKAGETKPVSISFSQAVSGFTLSDLTANDSSGVAHGTFSNLVTSDNINWTATYTPQVAYTGSVSFGVTAASYTDVAGNSGVAGASGNFAIDTVAPTVVITDDQPGVAGGAITYTFTFSEAVTNFSAAGVTVANGTKGTFTAVSATSYTLVVAPTSNFLGNVTVDIAANAAQDTVGNHSTVATQSVQAVDTRALTVLIADDKSGVTNGPITYTFTFSDAVTGFTIDDVTVANGTKGTLTTLSASSYSLVVQPTANFEGNVTVDIAANAAQDTAGKNSRAATQFVQLVDTLAPTVQAFTMASIPKAGETKPVSISFSQAVSGFTLSDLTANDSSGVAHGTFSNLVTTDNINWSATYTPQASYTGSVSFGVAAASYTDVAGNSGAAGASGNFAIDTVVPAVVSGLVTFTGADSTGVSKASTLVAGDMVLATVTMNKAVAVSGAATYDIMLDDGSIRTASYNAALSDPSGAHHLVFSYTVASTDLDVNGGVTSAANALHAVGTIQDATGNAANNNVLAVSSGANTISLDSSAPTVTNAGVLDGVSNLEVTSGIVLTFGTAVTAVTGGHITLVNDANSIAKAGYQGESVDHSINLYMGSSTSSAGVTTVQAFQDAGKTIASGTVSIVDATGVVTIHSLYDLDLSNNYHLEISAGAFTKTSNGTVNAAFGALNGSDYALNFSTVSPGLATASGNLAAAAASVNMDASGLTLAAGKAWVSIDVAGLGSPSTYQEIDLSTKNYALVIKNDSTTPGELALANNVYFALNNFTASNTLYFDDQNNASPIAYDSNAATQPSGYNGHLAYDMYTSTATGRGYVASVAFNGAAFDAALTAVGGHVVIG